MGNLPASYRVIGIGGSMNDTIQQLKDFGYDGVLYQSVVNNTEIIPSDEDKMAIFLTDGWNEELVNLSKEFYQAGVLTLIISTQVIENLNGICDSMTITNKESMSLVVGSLLNPIFNHGVVDFDFYDLANILHNSGKFKIIGSTSSSGDNRVSELVSSIQTLIQGYSITGQECLSLLLYQNKNIEPPLAVSELHALTEFIGSLPEDTNVIWALDYDDRMPTNEVRLDAIISGKALEFEIPEIKPAGM